MVGLSPSLLRASRRYLTRHPWNLWLSILGIGLGVAVVIAVDLANESARTAFRLSMNAVVGEATHQITAGPNGIDEQDYVDLRLTGMPGDLAPIVEGDARLGARDLTLLGVDPLAEAPFRDAVGEIGDDALRKLLTEPGGVMMSYRLAESLALQPGDSLTLEIGGDSKNATLVGRFKSDNPVARDSLLVADIATAQELLQRVGRLDRIDLRLNDDQARELEQVLPSKLRLERSESRTQATERMAEAFQINLAAMSLLALLVGGFIIYNTTTFSVLQRRPLFGHLRVLGVTRQELFRLILWEALLLGLLGAAIGILAGSLIAQGLIHLVTRTINDLYFNLNVSQLFISPVVLLKGLGIGLGATLAAALAPAWEASRAQPRDVQRRSGIEAQSRRILPKLMMVGLLLMALGYWLTRQEWLPLPPAFAALFLLIAGFSLCIPWLLAALSRILLPLLAPLAPPLGRLSALGILRSLSRTGPAVAALTVAVSATVGVGIMIGSFRVTVDLWLQQTLTSDIYVSVSDQRGGSLPADLPERIRDISGIEGFSIGRSTYIDTRNGRKELLAIQMGAHSYDGFRFKGESLPAIWPRFDNGELLLISEPYAYRHGLSAGDTVELFTPDGWRKFHIGAVFFDYGNDQGMLVMARETYVDIWSDDRMSALGIALKNDQDMDEVLNALHERVAGLSPSPRVRPTREIRQHSMAVFDRTFAITEVLRLLAIGVAFIGILSALLALHLERAKEHAVLRATGATPTQMRFLVMLQSTLLGLVAGLLALPLGWLMADILIHVINLRSFAWTMQSILPGEVLLQAIGLAIVSALLAGAYPAWRVAKAHPAQALREE